MNPFDFLVKMDFSFGKVTEAMSRATLVALQKAAYAIFKTAQGKITVSTRQSQAGQPPTSRRGQLRRAIRYDVDRSAEIAVIGPRESMVGTSAMAHEFGGRYKQQVYPKRPFMGPSMNENLGLIPGGFAGEVHE